MKNFKYLPSFGSFLTVTAMLSFLGGANASDALDDLTPPSSHNPPKKLAKWDMKQNDLGWKIGMALQSNKEIDSNENSRKKIIRDFDMSPGICTGYSVLWSYGRKISDDSPKNIEKRDDIEFFKSTVSLINNWDFNRVQLNKEDLDDIERFAGHLLNFQELKTEVFKEGKLEFEDISQCKNQIDLALTLEDTKRGAPIEATRIIDLILTKKILKERIKDFVKPGMMTFLGSRTLVAQGGEGHMMAVYQNRSDGRIFFFNPNVGEREFESLEGVVDKYWKALEPYWFENTDTFRRVSFIAYGFEQNLIPSYPSLNDSRVTNEEILDMFTNDPNLSTEDGANRSKLYEFLNKDNIPEDQLLSLLKDPRISEEVKNTILGNVPKYMSYNLND